MDDIDLLIRYRPQIPPIPADGCSYSAAAFIADQVRLFAMAVPKRSELAKLASEDTGLGDEAQKAAHAAWNSAYTSAIIQSSGVDN
jgi:hypothetical protein